MAQWRDHIPGRPEPHLNEAVKGGLSSPSFPAAIMAAQLSVQFQLIHSRTRVLFLERIVIGGGGGAFGAKLFSYKNADTSRSWLGRFFPLMQLCTQQGLASGASLSM